MRAEAGSWLRFERPPEAFASAMEARLTVPNPERAKRERMGLWAGGEPESLELFVRDGGDLLLPFGCLKDSIEEAKAIGEPIEWEQAFAPFRPIRLEGGPSLYPYQERAVEAMLRGRSGVLEAPCASGKTQMGLALIQRVGGRAVWLTHTQKLLKQSEERARALFPGGGFGEITEGRVRIGEDITFATVQTMSRLDPALYRDAFSCAVVDECQHAAGSPTRAMQFYRILCNLRCRWKFGLSATLERADGLTPCIFATIGPKLWSVSQADVGARIVKAEHRRVGVPGVVDPASYCGPDGMMDFARLLSLLCSDRGRDGLIAREAERRRAEGSAGQLLLTARVSHAEALASMIPGSSLLVGRVPEGKRDYSAPILVATYALAKEGLDIPRLDTLHLCTPTKDPIAVRQSAGRIERAFPGKLPPAILDYVDEGIPYCEAAYRKRRAILRK